MSLSRELSRRHFLSTTAAAVGGVALSSLLGREAIAADPPLYQISLAEWSLNKSILREKSLDHLDFPKAAKELGINAVEYVNQMFFDKAKDETYLGEMKKRAEDEGVRSLLIMCDREGALGDADDNKRLQAVDNHRKWLDAASFLGCHSIRVNAASSGSYEEQMKLAADGLARLTALAEQQNLSVLVENHGGLSSNGAWLAGVMQTVNHPHCGTLPDFGNFGINRQKNEWYDHYKGLEELMPYAQAVSAKSYDFVDDKPWSTIHAGHNKEHDYLKTMKIVVDAGYHGFVGIEYEGSKLPEREGILRTKALLEKCRDELSKKG